MSKPVVRILCEYQYAPNDEEFIENAVGVIVYVNEKPYITYGDYFHDNHDGKLAGLATTLDSLGFEVLYEVREAPALTESELKLPKKKFKTLQQILKGTYAIL